MPIYRHRKTIWTLSSLVLLTLLKPTISDCQSKITIAELTQYKLEFYKNSSNYIQNSKKLQTNTQSTTTTYDCKTKKHPAQVRQYQRFSYCVYPNPCKGNLCVEFEKMSPSIVVKITNNEGKTVYSINNPNQINIFSLPLTPSGTYIVSVSDETKEVVKRVTIN